MTQEPTPILEHMFQAAVEFAVVLAVVEIVETVVVSAVIVTTDLEVQDLKAITVAVNSFLYKKGGHFKNDRLFFLPFIIIL